ncbi:MAG: hypothetical protein MOB07_23530 [Acidobacteria bacterium]|nr:hypothetical protein [Acidobacteriota bacterium]
MDCKVFTDLIDSYLCGELKVETYHYMLQHVESCAYCRDELNASAQLRILLRRACTKELVSEQFRERLRRRLRQEIFA